MVQLGSPAGLIPGQAHWIKVLGLPQLWHRSQLRPMDGLNLIPGLRTPYARVAKKKQEKRITEILGQIMLKPLNKCQQHQSANFLLYEKNKHLFKLLLFGFSVTFNQISSLADKIL